MKPAITALILGLSGLSATPAFAQTQCAQFELVGSGARVTYQPFETSSLIEAFDMRVRRLADGISGVRFPAGRYHTANGGAADRDERTGSL